MRVSRHALVSSTLKLLPVNQGMSVLGTLLILLEDLHTDDRQANSLLETIALVVEQHVELEGASEFTLPTRKLWNIVRKAHFRSTSIRKLEAAVKIYGVLAAQGEMRQNAIGKLKDLLLHSYPTVGYCCHRNFVLIVETPFGTSADYATPRSETQLRMPCIRRCQARHYYSRTGHGHQKSSRKKC